MLLSSARASAAAHVSDRRCVDLMLAASALFARFLDKDAYL